MSLIPGGKSFAPSLSLFFLQDLKIFDSKESRLRKQDFSFLLINQISMLFIEKNNVSDNNLPLVQELFDLQWAFLEPELDICMIAFVKAMEFCCFNL